MVYISSTIFGPITKCSLIKINLIAIYLKQKILKTKNFIFTVHRIYYVGHGHPSNFLNPYKMHW